MANTVEIRTGPDSIKDITVALLSRAKRLFPNAGISGELVSMDAHIVFRIRHSKVLKFGGPWLVVIPLSSRWESKGPNRIAIVTDEMISVVKRYDMIVYQAEAFGIISTPRWP